MRKFYAFDHTTGSPEYPEQSLFAVHEETRAEQILSALDGLRICSALALLDRCKDAIMQLPMKLD